MPRKPAHLSRSGNSARGAARINASDDVPNTNSTEFAEKFSGKASTRDLMGDPSDSENEEPSPQKISYSAVARELKRPLREQRGVGHGQGKHPRTLVRRLMGMFEVMEAEQRKRAEYERLAQMCLEAICDPKMHISPQCEILGYSPVHLYIKYQALGIYFAYRAEGHAAICASEEAGWLSAVSGSTVRSWANDFVRSFMSDGDKTPKEPFTFSIYARGGHVQWLLQDEQLE